MTMLLKRVISNHMKGWVLLTFLVWIGRPLSAQTIIQKDISPPQRNVRGGGKITRIDYTRHKMIVHFVASDPNVAQFSSLHGPGHQNSWRLRDKVTKQEYALLYIKNIKVYSLFGDQEISVLDEPRGVRFMEVTRLSCEAHFERPSNRTSVVNLIEEDVEYYENTESSQWPYNVYDIRVLPFKDDMRNAGPVEITKKIAPTNPKPNLQKPLPKLQQKDSIVVTAPRTDTALTSLTPDTIENFSSTAKIGRTYRLNNLLFKQSDWHLEPSSYPQLDTLAAIMKQSPTMEIELGGHTDNVGNPQLNVELSRKRVEVVKDYLANKGILPSRIRAKAYGGSKPLADNSREATRKLNRRVEVTIVKE